MAEPFVIFVTFVAEPFVIFVTFVAEPFVIFVTFVAEIFVPSWLTFAATLVIFVALVGTRVQILPAMPVDLTVSGPYSRRSIDEPSRGLPWQRPLSNNATLGAFSIAPR